MMPDAFLVDRFESGERAVALDDRDALAHFGLARVATLLGTHDLAIAELEKAVWLNPKISGNG